ncbi:MAG: hypothetical protein PHV33_14610, partial [Elusimicrobiales bacterium]|nr:hypothetical protein [Elusimicrobiales bacterium]
MEERKRSGWKIWVYMSPIYIVLGVMLYRWNAKINSSDVGLSKEEYNAFNASEGEIKKHNDDGYNPGLNDSGYTVRYRSGDEDESSGRAGGGQDRQPAGRAGRAEDGRQAQEKGRNQGTE